LIKYLGSKRLLVPVLGELVRSSGAATALDLFTGTTRVAQEFKRRGIEVTAVDTARYSEVLACCYIQSDADRVDRVALAQAVAYLNALKGVPGYFTETFCVRSRFFQPFNGERIDAIRDRIDSDFSGSPLRPILLCSLLEAADRVDSTTGLQMAYVKKWAQRSFKPLELRVPALLPGPGRVVRDDAAKIAADLEPVGLAYLDPPYNQHRYYTNYHIWETLIAWDSPDHYGKACKRVDSRDDSTKSVFNRKREMPDALRELIANVRAQVVVVSYNNESWVAPEDLVDMCSVRGHVEVLAFDSKRYVGAQIGVYNPRGVKVGRVSHLRNVEYLVVSGPREVVTRMAACGASRHGSTLRPALLGERLE
jgi:adenine-specific DNA-methyltransferase